MTKTVPQLFATALRQAASYGSERCFYCGASCDEAHSATEYVKKSFTGRLSVACPDSHFVCAGCVLALRESAEIVVMGEVRQAQRIRNYSWVIDDNEARAFTKAHIAELRELCLLPPTPPFAIVLATSGQKQLLYRGVVNLDSRFVTVSLEEMHVTYAPDDLRIMLDVTGRLVAATGKPALDESPSLSLARAAIERYRTGEELFDQWRGVWESPLARLAAFLTDNKEKSANVYKSDVTTD